ncbi:MAG: type II toxin-antitoxin system YafQ family toxin [Candidatus Aminicenantes bacterium]|nr:type II toxin-antitoxin system YafQ family toxin [Candidatus Aminicenantes bacterium]
MLNVDYLKKFKKDLDKIIKSNKTKEDERKAEIRHVIECLAGQVKLEPKYKDHKLKGKKGEYKDRRECHIEPNLLLVYKIEGNRLTLERIGSHAELFR